MSTLGAWIVAVSVFAWADDAKNDAAKDDLKALQGAWTMSKVVVNGEDVPEDVLKDGKLVVDNNKYSATLGVSINSTFTLDPNKSPKTIDFKYTDGPQEGQMIKGIYEVEGDTFRLCRGLAPESERPTKFESAADSGVIFVVYKRTKPAAGDDKDKGKDKEAAIREEMARFQGVWQMIASESNGKKASEEFIRKTRVTITGNTHSVRVGDQLVAHDITFEIDPFASPKQVTDTLNGGAQKGQQIKGIYRLEGDQLTSCVAPVGAERPTEFASKAGSGHILRVFRRVKDTDEGTVSKAQAVQADLKKFAGKWRVVEMVSEGEVYPEDSLKEMRVTIEGNRFSSVASDVSKQGVFELDPTVRPKTIDLKITEGDSKGDTHLGIYEIEGDTYKVCLGFDGKPRPADFSTSAESGSVMQVLKRIQP